MAIMAAGVRVAGLDGWWEIRRRGFGWRIIDGPYRGSDLRDMAARGAVTPRTLVRRLDLHVWMRARDVYGLLQENDNPFAPPRHDPAPLVSLRPLVVRSFAATAGATAVIAPMLPLPAMVLVAMLACVLATAAAVLEDRTQRVET